VLAHRRVREEAEARHSISPADRQLPGRRLFAAGQIPALIKRERTAVEKGFLTSPSHRTARSGRCSTRASARDAVVIRPPGAPDMEKRSRYRRGGRHVGRPGPLSANAPFSRSDSPRRVSVCAGQLRDPPTLAQIEKSELDPVVARCAPPKACDGSKSEAKELATGRDVM